MSRLYLPDHDDTGQTPGAAWRRSPLGLLIPESRPEYDLPVAVDLFGGAGGFSMGFHQAGWHVAAAIEIDYWAAITYLVNLGRPPHLGGVQVHYDTEERRQGFERTVAKHLGLKPGKKHRATPARSGGLAGSGYLGGRPQAEQQYGCLHMWVADIRNVTGAEILDALGLDQGDVGCVIGGPPCQGFSKAGRRNVMDPRNSLVFEFARLVCEILPRTFAMENVEGIDSMITPEGVPVLDALAAAVSDGGYGEYEALVRALRGTGARAAVKGTRKTRRDPAGHQAEVEQPDLFAQLEVADA